MTQLGKQIAKPAASETITQDRTIKRLTFPDCIAEQHGECPGACVHTEQPIEFQCTCACHEGASA